MINLLPKENLAQLRRYERARALRAALAVLAVVLCLAIVFLLPTIMTVRERVDGVSHNLEAAKSDPGASEADNLDKMTKAANADLKLLAARSTTTTPMSDFVLRVLRHKPAGVSVTRVEKRDWSSYLVRGVSATRGALLTFTNALEGDEYFVEVISPIANLISTKDVNFSLEIKLNEGDEQGN